MMDPSNISLADEQVVDQNGVHEELSSTGKDSVVPNDVAPSVDEITETVAPNGNVNNVVQVDNAATNDSSLGKIKEGSNVYVENNV